MADPSSGSSKIPPICHFGVDSAWSGLKCGVIWLVRHGMGRFGRVLGWFLFFRLMWHQTTQSTCFSGLPGGFLLHLQDPNVFHPSSGLVCCSGWIIFDRWDRSSRHCRYTQQQWKHETEASVPMPRCSHFNAVDIKKMPHFCQRLAQNVLNTSLEKWFWLFRPVGPRYGLLSC
jgi:hypothetical protein